MLMLRAISLLKRQIHNINVVFKDALEDIIKSNLLTNDNQNQKHFHNWTENAKGIYD